jgi:hypothetical protein
MASNPFSGNDNYVACQLCGKPVYVKGDGFMRSFGAFVLLRCQNKSCGYSDWYGESEVVHPSLPYPGEFTPHPDAGL